jgi:hypothetical protein
MLLRSKSKYYIDMEVSKTGGDGWRFTGVYGEVKAVEVQDVGDVGRFVNTASTLECRGCVPRTSTRSFSTMRRKGACKGTGVVGSIHGALELCGLNDLGFCERCFHMEEQVDQWE